jgi:hypothetical protein
MKTTREKATLFGLATPKIETGMIVKYTHTSQEGREVPGWYRVRRVTKHTCNLGSIFGNTIYHKSIPLDQVKEDQDNWYKKWQQSESYQSM